MRAVHGYAVVMPTSALRNRSLAWGWVLVAIQVVLFLAVALWPSSWGPATTSIRELGGVLFLLGGIGIVLSALYLGRALTPIPLPNGAGLTARGVYRWVRHPMYTSVLVLCVGVATSRGALAVWVGVVLLAVFFELKTRLEEKYLIDAYDGYAAYASRTGKFVPLVGRLR
jgi:protein-S-isoprenylcysteine O-methyltransferase Ste14